MATVMDFSLHEKTANCSIHHLIKNILLSVFDKFNDQYFPKGSKNTTILDIKYEAFTD